MTGLAEYLQSKGEKDIIAIGVSTDDRWADNEILSDLQKCFAHYDKDDIKRALIRTHELFARITRELAEAEGYEYPQRKRRFCPCHGEGGDGAVRHRR